MNKYTTLLGRLLLGQIFLLAGISKVGAYAATQGWMESLGVPGILLPAVILLEIGGGAALILGWAILGQGMAPRQIVGALIVIGAVILIGVRRH